MARMHSRKKGESRSIRPVTRTSPEWVIHKTKEIELIVTKLYKEGKTMSEIGITLRDSYGIPDVKKAAGKSISDILKEKKLLKDIPEDMTNLIRRALQIRKHMESNHKDMPAKRGLQLTESKIKRMIKYYKGTKVLPMEFKYDPKTVSRYIE